jgi:hypothetical protein
MTKILLVILAGVFTSVAQAERGEPFDYSESARQAAENARANNQANVEAIIRREVEARRPQSSARRPARRPSKVSKIQNCGQGYWKKSEALRSCPEATAMKAYTVTGQAYFYCDCSGD